MLGPSIYSKLQCTYREDLRQRFVKAESILFRVRYEEVETSDRESFLAGRDFNWVAVSATGCFRDHS